MREKLSAEEERMIAGQADKTLSSKDTEGEKEEEEERGGTEDMLKREENLKQMEAQSHLQLHPQLLSFPDP